MGTHHDLEEVFEIHRRGLTTIERAECVLDDVNDAIEQVLDGSAPAPRLVFRLGDQVEDTLPHITNARVSVNT